MSLLDLSVETEIVVADFVKETCKEISNSSLKEIKLIVECNPTSLNESDIFGCVINIVHLVWSRFPETKFVFVSAIFSSHYCNDLLENVYKDEITLNSVVDFNELCSIFKQEVRNDSFSICWN